MSNRNVGNVKQGHSKPEKGDEANLLVFRGVGSVERVSTNVILVKTTPEERITRVDEKGNKRQIILTSEREVHLKEPLPGNTKGRYSVKRDSKVQGSSRGTSPIPETESDTDGSGSPTVSHPPEAVAQCEDYTKHLEEELSKTQAALHRLEDAQRHVNGVSETSKKRGTMDELDAKRQNEEYSKMRRQLKKALDANQAWSNYSSNQLKVHLKQLQTKDEKLRQVEEKMKTTKSEAAASEKVLKANVVEMENQLKDRKLDEEQKKVRKLARELVKNNDDFKTEIQGLKEELARLKSAQSQKADHISTDINSNMSTTSSELRDSSSGLSNSLRNVESAMGNEQLLHIETVNVNTENRFTGKETLQIDGKQPSPDAASPIPSESSEVIYFLKEQLEMYRNDFTRERQDRERAFGELEKLRKELENAKLMLHQQGEVKEKRKTKKVLSRFTSKPLRDLRKSHSEGSSAGQFRYLDPEEVTEIRERRTTEERRQNTYEDDDEARNHVYHEIDE
ncbi:hypothetical protein HOLleu_37747 [Holothuria leucospilota]|uniref:NF-kappa-B essential modulator NEMO CC2-LZ domain-containing protein n=1 Tax=Holothuria leucospilota TaxID=206669 RepID=A0A9Q1BDK6_HOLLE|nr:hypothetical protein HOLleu_37747 [Holothuria leucospilota]